MNTYRRTFDQTTLLTLSHTDWRGFLVGLSDFPSNRSIFSKFTGWHRFGSVWLRFGDGTVRAVPVFGSGGSSEEGFFCVFQCSFTEEDGSSFGSWKAVPAVPVPRSVPAKTVPTVPVSGSGSVPGPP